MERRPEKPAPGALGDHVIIMGARGAGGTVWARDQRRYVPHEQRSQCATDAEYLYRCAGLGVGSDPADVLEEGTGPVPFRAPHHSISMLGLTGRLHDGWRLRPGELALAHGGILFLDDATEFPTVALQMVATVARRERVRLVFNVPDEGQSSMLVPARFRLVAFAAMCPCGLMGSDSGAECRCSASAVEKHGAKLAPLRELCRLVPLGQWLPEARRALARGADV